jgi:hypothetical protein
MYKKSSVFEGHKLFKEGRENVEDDVRSCRPRSDRTDKNTEKVRNLVHSDRLLIIRAMAVQLNLDKETVKRPELWSNDWILHHDNAPAEKVLSVKEFLAQKSINEIEH